MGEIAHPQAEAASPGRDGGPRRASLTRGDRINMRRVLMIAYHFPPMKGSSGLQRTLGFARELRHHGWQPRILSTWRFAYPAVSDEQMGDIPDDVVVRRTPCIDVARHLSVRGAYPGFLARPDRWSTWLPGLVARGIVECASWKPDLVWSTFPIPSAVVGGRVISRWSGLPWILDLRDSMTEDHYPPDPSSRRRLRAIESKAVRQARAVVFTSAGAAGMYAERYRDIPGDRWQLIPNGYDEGHFAAVESASAARPRQPNKRTVLLHSGLLDPVDRDPSAFFRALANLKARRAPGFERLRVRLRATGNDRRYQAAIREAGVAELVELAPALPYDDALREMIDADGLLAFQGANCNHQTPAKLYEYFRSGTPVLGLTDPEGDTAAVMRMAGLPESSIAPIGDAVSIEMCLSRFLADLQAGRASRANAELTRQWSRAHQALQLAALMDRIVGETRPSAAPASTAGAPPGGTNA
jgi:glycosyltransferase involved in cell wall biosynthesis